MNKNFNEKSKNLKIHNKVNPYSKNIIIWINSRYGINSYLQEIKSKLKVKDSIEVDPVSYGYGFYFNYDITDPNKILNDLINIIGKDMNFQIIIQNDDTVYDYKSDSFLGLNNFSERIRRCFDFHLDPSGRLDKQSTKDQIDEYMMSLLDTSKFEVKPSPLGGNGLFAKVKLNPRSIITEKVLPQTYMADGLSEYYSKWAPGKLITGVGYFANGSCRIFEELPEGTKVGPYTTTKSNVILWDKPDAPHPRIEFMVVNPIKAGDEIIVNYEDPYFFPKVKTPIKGYPNAVDATKLIINHNPLKLIPSHLDKKFIENLYK